MCDREQYPERNVGGFFSNRKMFNAVSVTVCDGLEGEGQWVQIFTLYTSTLLSVRVSQNNDGMNTKIGKQSKVGERQYQRTLDIETQKQREIVIESKNTWIDTRNKCRESLCIFDSSQNEQKEEDSFDPRRRNRKRKKL